MKKWKTKNTIQDQTNKITIMRRSIIREQELKDKVLLDNACKKWATMDISKKNKFENDSVNIVGEDDPIDMDVVCLAAKENNFKEAIPNDDYRAVIKSLLENKRIVRLTETNLINLIKRIISESTTGDIESRKYKINSDGTVSVTNMKSTYIKVRFKAMGSNINIADISKSGSDYKITTKNGTTKTIEKQQVKELISFVDSGSTTKDISTGMLSPSLTLIKV